MPIIEPVSGVVACIVCVVYVQVVDGRSWTDATKENRDFCVFACVGRIPDH